MSEEFNLEACWQNSPTNLIDKTLQNIPQTLNFLLSSTANVVARGNY